MGTVTAIATPVKISNIQAAINLELKSTDPLDHIIWKFSVVRDQYGVDLSTTGAERYELISTKPATATIPAETMVYDLNTCSIYSDAATLFRTDIFYLDSQNRKGSCHNWTDLPVGYQTIYKYSPPTTNTANVIYKVVIIYTTYQDLMEHYFDGSTSEWSELTVDVNYEVKNDSQTNNDVFQHYLHNGALAKSAFSIKPYELLPGATDGSLFVDPLGPNYSANTGAGTTLSKSAYFPATTSDSSGFTWNAASFGTYIGAGGNNAYSIPFTLSSEGPIQEFMFSTNNLTGSWVTGIISKNPNSVINVKGVNCLTSPSGAGYCSYSYNASLFTNSLYFGSDESRKWVDYLPPGETFYLNIFPFNGNWGSGTTLYVTDIPRSKSVDRAYPAQAADTSLTLPSGWAQQDWPLVAQTQVLNAGGNVTVIPANSGVSFRIPVAMMNQLRVASGMQIGVEGGGFTMISKYPGNRDFTKDGWTTQPRYYLFTKNGIRQTSSMPQSSCGWLEENTIYYLNVFNSQPNDINPQISFIPVL